MTFDPNRRKAIASMGLAPALLVPGTLGCMTNQMTKDRSTRQPVGYNINDPNEQLLIFEKLRGDLSGQLTYSISEGRVFGIRPDLPDELNQFGKEVIRFYGCSMRIKRVLDNGNVETKSRSWLLYQHPETGEFIDEMENPYTGEVVEIPPFRGGISGSVMTPNGPEVSANFKMESTAFNTPLNMVFSQTGPRMHVTRHAFTKWFEKRSETWRTEMTLDTYDFDADLLNDRSLSHIPSDTHWMSQTSWLSILKMSGTPGHMLWSTNGRVVFDKSELPAEFIEATENKQPDIFSQPLNWESE